MIAAGLDEDDVRLKGTLKNRKCKPANRKIKQLWRKLLVTDQDMFNTEADSTLDKTLEGTHRKAPRKMKAKTRRLNVKNGMDKAMAM